jgi:DNA-binding IclR family transcriptional regulator
MDNKKDDDKYLVPGLSRGLEILQLFDEQNTELSLSEIAQKMGINRSSAFRIVYTLELCEFLRKNDAKKYSLGLKILEIGSYIMDSIAINDYALPIMKDLRNDVGIAVHLSVLDGIDAVYINTLQGLGMFTSNIKTGERWPSYATVTGQLLLAGLSDKEIKERFKDFNDWQLFSDITAQNIDELLHKVAVARQSSYLISWQKFRNNMLACAAPIINPHTSLVKYVISVSCPAMTYTPHEFETEVAPKVIEAANKISPYAYL